MSEKTSQILSPWDDAESQFWLTWKLDHAHVAQLQLGRKLRTDPKKEEVVIKWPIPVTFKPSRITAHQLKRPEPLSEIRCG